MAGRWRTADGMHLIEGEPQSERYGSQPEQPLLPGAHCYRLQEPESGTVVQRWVGDEVFDPPFGDHEIITRYAVIGARLVRVVFHYREDSCYGFSACNELRRETVLEGLESMVAS